MLANCYILDHGTFFRNRLKSVWAQIFNIWDSKDGNLMPFDIIWHHSALLDAIRYYFDTIRHYFDTIRHYWNTIWTLLDTIRQPSDTIRSNANLKYVPIVENIKLSVSWTRN